MQPKCFAMVAVAVATFMLPACQEPPGNAYARAVQEGLSEARVDTLLEGITFGMTREGFHELAGRGNREERYTIGTGTSIRMAIPDGHFEAGGFLDFFPQFEGNQVSGAFGRIFINDWSPSDQSTHADSLLPRSLAFYEDLFPGNPFVEYADTHRPTYYKIDGNRRVILYPHRLRYVSFEVTDLSTASEEVLSGEDLSNPDDPFYLNIPTPTAVKEESSGRVDQDLDS